MMLSSNAVNSYFINLFGFARGVYCLREAFLIAVRKKNDGRGPCKMIDELLPLVHGLLMAYGQCCQLL